LFRASPAAFAAVRQRRQVLDVSVRRRFPRVHRLHEKMRGVRAVARSRLQSVYSLADRESGCGARPDRVDRAGEVIAERHGELRGAEEGKQPAPITSGAAHVDGIDRGGRDGDLNFIHRRTGAWNFAHLESAARFGRETHGDEPRFRAVCGPIELHLFSLLTRTSEILERNSLM
jgi:hypothetical protein